MERKGAKSIAGLPKATVEVGKEFLAYDDYLEELDELKLTVDPDQIDDAEDISQQVEALEDSIRSIKDVFRVAAVSRQVFLAHGLKALAR